MAGDWVTQPGAGVDEPQQGGISRDEQMRRLAEVAGPVPREPMVQLEIDALVEAAERNALTAAELIDRVQPVSQQFDPESAEKLVALHTEAAATGVPLVDRIHEATVMLDKTTAGLRRAITKLEL